MWTTLLVSLSALATTTVAQNRTVCGWEGARSGVVRDSMYLSGGLRSLGIWSADSNTFGSTLIEDDYELLYKLNFSTRFDIRTSDLQSLFEPVNVSPDASAPRYVDGALLADDDEFYAIGGRAYPSVNTQSASEGNLHGALFQPNEAATGFRPGYDPSYLITADVTKFVTLGASVSIPSENLGFYFSGLARNDSEPLSYVANATTLAGTLVDNMLRVDTSSAGNAAWTESGLIPDVIPRAGASMVWIPTGARGVLVVIGGYPYPEHVYNPPLSSTQIEVNDNTTSLTSTVSVYDIEGDSWYQVDTQGSPPSSLVQACAVVASASDSSSHQIYVYGGRAGTGNNPPSDDVWILSVPSFQWIRATTGDTRHGRFAHSCAKPYPNQMIVVGGITEYKGALKTQAVIDVFDLNTLTWTGTYDPTVWSPYKIPSAVYSVIGGNADGGPINVASGLDTDLSATFTGRYTKNITNWYPYAAEATPAPPKKSVAVPVAVSVVVVVVVLVTAIIAWCCFCSPTARKRRSQKSSDDSTRMSNNFVSKWVNGSAQFPPPPPKSIISSDATEIGESLSPRAEVAGFSYFSPRAHHGGASEVDGAPLYGNSTGPTPRATSPSSPGSHRSAELEAPTPPAMSQILSGQRNTEVYRNHPFYPPSIGGQSSGSGPLQGRFANARAPSETTSNAVELPQNRSNENVALAPPQTEVGNSQSDKSNTETSTEISAPSHSGADASVTTTQHSSDVTSADQVAQQTTKESASKQQSGKSYPPTALSNIASSKTPHHRSTSSASSGMAITLSPTSPGTFATLSPTEEQRRSDHISLLPDHLPRSVLADTEADQNGTTNKKGGMN